MRERTKSIDFGCNYNKIRFFSSFIIMKDGKEEFEYVFVCVINRVEQNHFFLLFEIELYAYLLSG